MPVFTPLTESQLPPIKACAKKLTFSVRQMNRGPMEAVVNELPLPLLYPKSASRPKCGSKL